MGFNIASVIFSDNTVQSVFHGLKWSWQDYFTLQVGKVVEKYQLKESLSFRLKLGRNVPINPINSVEWTEAKGNGLPWAAQGLRENQLNIN